MKFKIKESTDKLNELNGRENSIAKCARIFEEYKQNPTNRLRDELKVAYEAIPEATKQKSNGKTNMVMSIHMATCPNPLTSNKKVGPRGQCFQKN